MRIRTLNQENFNVAYECTVLLYNFYNESQDRRAATRTEILDAAIACAEQGLEYGESADMHCSLAMLYFEKARISTTGPARADFFDLSIKEIEKATDLDKNNRKAFEVRKAIEKSKEGSLHNLDIFNLYKLARREGFDEKWVISQGSDLVDPVWDFLKERFIPSFDSPGDAESRPEGKGPDA